MTTANGNATLTVAIDCERIVENVLAQSALDVRFDNNDSKLAACLLTDDDRPALLMAAATAVAHTALALMPITVSYKDVDEAAGNYIIELEVSKTTALSKPAVAKELMLAILRGAELTMLANHSATADARNRYERQRDMVNDLLCDIAASGAPNDPLFATPFYY